MRGKKINVDFVSEYISNCAKTNKNSVQDICNEAQKEIEKIDAEFKKIEELKRKKSCLQDVLIHFNKANVGKLKDKEILSFYNIPDLKSAYFFCQKLVENQEVQIIGIDNANKENIKQMLNVDILRRENNKLLPGNKIEDFLEFYSRTYKG